ncbi:hypothetical protein ANASTE_01035 [Anaerofustis stercorihominis DSM 17244]|uniref:Uncharacterized protein n=1 Tax=Anaerofustis stercorihominis DSM 17244 TaxID=445971 RepID=B1C8H8_9FIRM|nr:hypothetical protein ANASTE_01035 [Anaerofustis stercorihominis DSM 17244]
MKGKPQLRRRFCIFSGNPTKPKSQSLLKLLPLNFIKKGQA